MRLVRILPLTLLFLFIGLPAMPQPQGTVEPVVEADPVSAAEAAEPNTFHLPFIAPEDQAYYLTLDPNERAMIAVRRDLWSYQERMRFEPFQKHHAKTFPDTPVPTSIEDLSPKQLEELKHLKIGMQTYTFMKPNDPETSALYASPLFRHSDAFRGITERNRREAQAARERVDQASRKSRRGGRGSSRGLILLLVGGVWGLAFVYKKFVMKK